MDNCVAHVFGMFRCVLNVSVQYSFCKVFMCCIDACVIVCVFDRCDWCFVCMVFALVVGFVVYCVCL